MPIWILVYPLYVCVHVCAGAHMCAMYTCTHSYRGQRSTSALVPQVLFAWLWKQSLKGLGLTEQSRLGDQPAPGILLSLTPNHLDCKWVSAMLRFFVLFCLTWVLWIKLRLQGRHFTEWTFFPDLYSSLWQQKQVSIFVLPFLGGMWTSLTMKWLMHICPFPGDSLHPSCSWALLWII